MNNVEEYLRLIARDWDEITPMHAPIHRHTLFYTRFFLA